MSSNTVDSSYNINNNLDGSKNELTLSGSAEISKGRYLLTISQGSLNLIAFLLIGMVVGINIQFAYRLGTNLNPVQLHIVLCVLGYQALMGVGLLILAPESSYSHIVSPKHKRLIHGILMFSGSALALTGSFIVTKLKNKNFDTIHGITSLPATICSMICFFNGLASFYYYGVRNSVPGNFSKVTHIISGIIAFSMATVSLGYGLDKNSFRTWSTHEFTTVVCVFLAIFTAIVLINPFVILYKKLSNSEKND